MKSVMHSIPDLHTITIYKDPQHSTYHYYEDSAQSSPALSNPALSKVIVRPWTDHTTKQQYATKKDSEASLCLFLAVCCTFSPIVTKPGPQQPSLTKNKMTSQLNEKPKNPDSPQPIRWNGRKEGITPNSPIQPNQPAHPILKQVHQMY